VLGLAGQSQFSARRICVPAPDHAANIARGALLFVRDLQPGNKINKNRWDARALAERAL
jgi:hypothetical protein|tara:strand:- start:8412 stop:8588 length:177 start_codon:yes stop_codon:yes gene_type:complete